MTASVCVEHSPSCMLCWPTTVGRRYLIVLGSIPNGAGILQWCSGFIIFTTASEGDEAVMQGMIAARLRAEPTCRLI